MASLTSLQGSLEGKVMQPIFIRSLHRSFALTIVVLSSRIKVNSASRDVDDASFNRVVHLAFYITT